MRLRDGRGVKYWNLQGLNGLRVREKARDLGVGTKKQADIDAINELVFVRAWLTFLPWMIDRFFGGFIQLRYLFMYERCGVESRE